MKPVIRYQSQLLYRKSYKPARVDSQFDPMQSGGRFRNLASVDSYPVDDCSRPTGR